jgi:hypothetical protein
MLTCKQNFIATTSMLSFDDNILWGTTLKHTVHGRSMCPTLGHASGESASDNWETASGSSTPGCPWEGGEKTAWYTLTAHVHNYQ